MGILNPSSFQYHSANFAFPQLLYLSKKIFVEIVAYTKKRKKELRQLCITAVKDLTSIIEIICVSLAVYITACEYFLLLCDEAQDVAERNGALWLVCLYLQCVTPMVCAAAASYP